MTYFFDELESGLCLSPRPECAEDVARSSCHAIINLCDFDPPTYVDLRSATETRIVRWPFRDEFPAPYPFLEVAVLELAALRKEDNQEECNTLESPVDEAEMHFCLSDGAAVDHPSAEDAVRRLALWQSQGKKVLLVDKQYEFLSAFVVCQHLMQQFAWDASTALTFLSYRRRRIADIADILMAELD